jgi:uncharacterized membrane protein YvbJ
MKVCPNCRMESRGDADWCWHCGYSYEEAEARANASPSPDQDHADRADCEHARKR